MAMFKRNWLGLLMNWLKVCITCVMSDQVSPRYKSLPTILLYISNLSSFSPVLIPSLQLGGRGVLTVLQFSKPASEMRLVMYFCCEINIPFVDLAISSCRKYFIGPRFFLLWRLYEVNSWFHLCLTLTVLWSTNHKHKPIILKKCLLFCSWTENGRMMTERNHMILDD